MMRIQMKTLVLSFMLIMTSCSAEDADFKAIQCWSDGEFLGVLDVERSIFDATPEPDNSTHAKKYCVDPTEMCVPVNSYASPVAKPRGYACSTLPAGWLSCNGEDVDARVSVKHCGTCGNACDQGQKCENGFCVGGSLDGDACFEDRCNADGNTLYLCQDHLIKTIFCRQGCVNAQCYDDGTSNDLPCSSNEQCGSGYTCHTKLHRCVRSNENTCDPEKFDVFCDGEFLVSCQVDHVEHERCGEGKMCVVNKCVSQQSSECSQGSWACSSDRATATRCSDTGKWIFETCNNNSCSEGYCLE